MFAWLSDELCSGRKRIRATRTDNTLILYAHDGTVNITFNGKEGSL